MPVSRLVLTGSPHFKRSVFLFPTKLKKGLNESINTRNVTEYRNTDINSKRDIIIYFESFESSVYDISEVKPVCLDDDTERYS